MNSNERPDLKSIQEEIKKIRSVPLTEHSVRFAAINQELARKLQEIESN